MNNAELYNENNDLQKINALQCLNEYAKKLKWKNEGETVIDIGSGDGSVTVSILQQFLPGSSSRVLGCDISDNMVQFANKHYATATTSFAVLDIEADLPEQFVGKFDHVFSFNTLHWIKQQETAFSNIYKLLKKGGDCLLMFQGDVPAYNLYRIVASQPKWRNWLKDYDHYSWYYQNCKNSEKLIHRMMKNIGFTNVDVQCKDMTFNYRSVQSLKNLIAALLPFEMPKDMLEDFLEDFLKIIWQNQRENSVYNIGSGVENIMITYQLIFVYGKKS